MIGDNLLDFSRISCDGNRGRMKCEIGILCAFSRPGLTKRASATEIVELKPMGVGEMEGQTKVSSQPAVIEDAISERRLWIAVLVMAVEDWLNGTLRAKRAAQRFLFEDDRDFTEVCAGAGMDPSSFRSKLMKIGRRVEMEGPLAHSIAA